MSIFFFNDTATTEIYTLSLHDALPILAAGDRKDPARMRRRAHLLLARRRQKGRLLQPRVEARGRDSRRASRRLQLPHPGQRSEEHTSELQSRQYLVCRLLLEKKKKNCR